MIPRNFPERKEAQLKRIREVKVNSPYREIWETLEHNIVTDYADYPIKNYHVEIPETIAREPGPGEEYHGGISAKEYRFIKRAEEIAEQQYERGETIPQELGMKLIDELFPHL